MSNITTANVFGEIVYVVSNVSAVSQMFGPGPAVTSESPSCCPSVNGLFRPLDCALTFMISSLTS
jgi:hypothetical protein